MKKLIPGRVLISALLLFLISFSCKESDDVVNTDPTNIVLDITVEDSATGKIIIAASAVNAIEYQLYIDLASEPASTNSTGNFEYILGGPGIYRVEVRAYGVSGRYVKAERNISIDEGDPITIEDGYISPESYPDYELVWSDEFDGTQVNTEYWSFEIGTGYNGWGNNESQYYRKENASVAEGTLIIEARKENFQSSNYTSARLVTRNKKSFQYGRIDIRALLPVGQGMWPALWMLGNNFQTAGWPASGEIDIMEMIGGKGRENTVHGVLHWDDNGHVQAGGNYKLPSGTFADEYHVFSLIWDETNIKWLVNNVQYNVINITPSHMTEYHQPGFFIFNLAVGGNWPGYPDATTVFPQQFKIDYIRVFQ